MSESNNPTLTPDEHDRLISRIVDGEASAQDWDNFRAVAAHDQSVWAELSQTQQTQGLLADALRSRAAIADTVELPEHVADPERYQSRFDAISRWGGWAAAAALLLVWVTGGLPAGQANNMSQQAGLGPSLSEATPEQTLNHYMNSGRTQGRVISEVPNPVVVSAQPTEDGRVEVVFIRQIVERKFVTDIYTTTTTDEFGNPITTPARLEPDTQPTRLPGAS